MLLPLPSLPTFTGRFRALTMPVVTVASSPNGDPMATTAWPTWSESDDPMVTGVRPLTPSAWITAVSVSGSVPTMVALAWVPSLNDTSSSPESPATSTTWLLVRIWPSEVRMIPEPEPWPSAPATSIFTTDGSTVWATCSIEPSPDAAAGVSTTGDVERGADDDAVSASFWEVQTAAPPTPAPAPTTSAAATTAAANAPGRRLRSIGAGGGTARSYATWGSCWVSYDDTVGWGCGWGWYGSWGVSVTCRESGHDL